MYIFNKQHVYLYTFGQEVGAANNQICANSALAANANILFPYHVDCLTESSDLWKEHKIDLCIECHLLILSYSWLPFIPESLFDLLS